MSCMCFHASRTWWRLFLPPYHDRLVYMYIAPGQLKIVLLLIMLIVHIFCTECHPNYKYAYFMENYSAGTYHTCITCCRVRANWAFASMAGQFLPPSSWCPYGYTIHMHHSWILSCQFPSLYIYTTVHVLQLTCSIVPRLLGQS